MQISSGWARGMTLAAPAGESTRPTGAKVRAAIANILQPYLDDAMVLDLFAGSGALGLEAASRGARGVAFVEQATPALASLRKNVDELLRRAKAQDLVEPQILVESRGVEQALQGTAASRLNHYGSFDVIVMDPPYAAAAAWLRKLGPILLGLASAEAVLVCETATSDEAVITENAAEVGWRLDKTRRYGDTLVSVWHKADT